MIRKHPSNRAERMQIEKIKKFGKETKSGRVRRYRLEHEEGERLDHELSEFEIREGQKATEPMA